jgi:hypothetical protein
MQEKKKKKGLKNSLEKPDTLSIAIYNNQLDSELSLPPGFLYFGIF